MLDRLFYLFLPWWGPWPRDPMRNAREFEQDSDRRLRTMAVTEIELARDRRSD